MALVEAVRRYFGPDSVTRIAQATGVASNMLPRLAKKCLTPGADGMILGFRALIPFTRIKSYDRKAAESFKFPEAHGGLSGSLSQLLDKFPDIEEALVRHIRQDVKLRKIPEFRLRPRDLHRIFINLIKEKGASRTEWPFTTKHLGIRTIQKYMRSVLDRNFARSVQVRESQESRAHLSVGTGHDAFLSYDEPYAAVEIDAYKIESHLSVAIQTPEGTETEMALERLWLIAAVDRFSSAVLSYTVVYRSEVTATDVLRVIRDAATQRWKPLELTIPLKYPQGGGLPSGVIEDAYGAVWTCTLLDGALVHLSEAVHERARKALGFSINWGPVGHFERRPNVEKTFDKIGKDLFRRLPSTTGGGPHKGRADDAQQKAVRYRIRASDIEQLLDVTVAHHNMLPSEGTSSMSPLEVLRYFLEGSDNRFLVRRLPNMGVNYAKKFHVNEKATVRGGRGAGRRPYIQLDRVHYTSEVLANAGQLVGKSLIVAIDEEDFRQVHAFLENGADLGILKAHGKWGVTKHSRRTRKAINSLLNKRVIALSEFDDPVQVYMRYIAQPVNPKKQKSLTARQVTQLTRLASEAGQPPHIPAVRTPAPVPSVPVPASQPMSEAESRFFAKVRNRR